MVRDFTVMMSILLSVTGCARHSTTSDNPPGTTKVAMERNGNCSAQVRNDAQALAAQGSQVDRLELVSRLVGVFSEETQAELDNNYNQALTGYRVKVREFSRAYGDFECNFAAEKNQMKVLSSAAIYASPNEYAVTEAKDVSLSLEACAPEMATAYRQVLTDVRKPVQRLKDWVSYENILGAMKNAFNQTGSELDEDGRSLLKAMAPFRRRFAGDYDCALNTESGRRIRLNSKALDERIATVFKLFNLGLDDISI